jgi:hypothetical protein
MQAKQRVMVLRAERLAVLAVNGVAAIEFRCGGVPRNGILAQRAGNPENVS